jgi:ferredoxin
MCHPVARTNQLVRNRCMPLFSVDEEKCDLCQLCVSACPAGLVGMMSDASVRTPIDRSEGSCFECGHCVAAYPTEAFSHRNATCGQCLPIRDELRISPAQIGQLMRARRSVRNFTDQVVAHESIAELQVDMTANTWPPLRQLLALCGRYHADLFPGVHDPALRSTGFRGPRSVVRTLRRTGRRTDTHRYRYL